LPSLCTFYFQNKALEWGQPVPPRFEETLAQLVQKAKMYSTVTAVPNRPNTWLVGRSQNTTVKCKVVMSELPHTPPECCAWSRVSGIPCYHGAAVILLNHGHGNMWKFVERRHLSAAWKDMYRDVEYKTPPQHVFDGIMLEAKKLVLSGDHLHMPKALPPPRGRPVKNAGERKQSWYEQGTAKPKKRIYLCTLCRSKDHTREKCELRQMFDETEPVE